MNRVAFDYLESGEGWTWSVDLGTAARTAPSEAKRERGDEGVR